MNRIPKNLKPKVFDPSKNGKVVKKINPIAENLIKPLKLENTPMRDSFFYEVFDEKCLDNEKAKRLFEYGINFLQF